MGFDQDAGVQAGVAPAVMPAAAATALPATSEPAPAAAAAPANTPGQAANPVLASVPAPLKTIYSDEKIKGDDDASQTTKTEVQGGVDTEAKTASGAASRTSSSEAKDASGGSTKAATTVNASGKVGVDGGKGAVSVSKSTSQDRGDGTKNGASSTASGGVEVKDGKTSVDGAVSSERTASYEDKGSGEKNAQSDKGSVDVHVADGDTHAGGAYDRKRSADDGAGATSETTAHVEGHLGEKDSGGKASYAKTTATDDKEGDKSSTSTTASGSVNVDAKGGVTGGASAARTATTETKDAATGGSTQASTAVKGDVAVDKDGGKGSASVSHTDSQDNGAGTKNSSTTTGSGGVIVKDGKTAAEAAVSSERAASTEDKDSGEKTARSDKAGVDIHLADGDTKAGASYDRKRSTDNGAAKTDTTTHVDGHIGEKDSAASAARTSTVETKDESSGRNTKSETVTSGGVTVDDKGTTASAGRKASSTEGDGKGATETASTDTSGKVSINKSGEVSADAAGKVARDWKYADDKSPLATNRGGSADGSIHVDKDKVAVQGAGEVHRSATDEDGHSSGQSGKVSAGATTNAKGETTWNADGTVKSSQGYADKDTKVAGGTEKSATASMSSGPEKTEVKADIAAKKTLDGGEDIGKAENTAHAGGGVSVDKKGVTTVTGGGGVESKQTLKTPDGTASQSTKKDVSVALGTDGSFKGTAGGSRTHEDTHTDADGKETKTANSKSVTVTAGEDADGTKHIGVGGGASKTTTNPDGTTSSKGVDGGVEVTAGPGKAGVAGHVGVQQDGTKVSVSGGYNQTFGLPVKGEDGKWSVPYASTASAGAEAGGGKDAKASGSVSGSSSTFGTRTFASEEEAKAFYAKGEVPALEVPKTAADAKNLPPGTTIGTSSSGSAGGSAGGSGGGVGVTASAEAHGGHSIAVTSKGDGVVEVTAGTSSGKSGSVGVSGGPASASVGKSTDHDESKKVQFDLNTPAGQAAYEQYLKDPSKVPDGGKVMETQDHDQKGSKFDISMVGHMGEQKTLDTTTVKNDKGEVISKDQKGTTGESISVPLLGHADEKLSLNVHTDKDGNRTYVARKDIDDSMASDANSALAKATNTKEDRNVSGKTQGKWSVDTTYSDQQMETFAKKVESGEYKSHVGVVGDSANEALKQELAAAGKDPDKRKAALANFAKNGGDSALSQIKAATGEDGEHHVALAGDKYLTGAAGREALDKQIADTQKQVYGGGGQDPGTVGDVRALLAAQKERAREVGNPANYAELPAGVRAQEVARSKADIEKLELLLATAKDDRAAMADPADNKGSTPAGGGNAPKTPGAVEPTAEQAKLQENSETLAKARAENDKAYADARLQHKVQDGYYNGNSTGRSAREQLGEKTFGVFDNTETKAYSHADKAYADAQAALKEANKQEGVYDRTGDDSPADSAASAEAARKGAEAHRLAAQKFAEAQKEYEAIAARNKTEARPGTFDGQNKQLQPGE